MPYRTAMDGSGYRAREDHRAGATPGGRLAAGPRHAELSAAAATLNAALPVQRLEAMRPPNRTGLPDRLKEGVEAMSGMSLDSVRVHYNSSQPAQLNALAYAQGSDIHVAPGQERHLPHEAWHVVQQAQGRVRPTMQMKGDIPVNDEVGLEREADAMGARAAQGGDTAAGPSGHVATGSGPAIRQMYVAPALSPLGPWGHQPLYANVYQSRDQTFVDTNWVAPATSAYQTIQVARPNLEQDEEIAELDELERQLDLLVTRANGHVLTFDQTPAHQRVAICNDLDIDRAEIMDLLADIQEKFVVTEGGFSAKGRATALDDVDISGENQGEIGTDDSFINNITINDDLLSDKVGVVKPAAVPVPGPQRLRVDGVLHQPGDDRAFYADNMTALNVPQTVNLIGAFAGRPRGPGQEAGMNGTNARGYAWATSTPGWNTTQWEWLHIRGASLGGETDATNLVLGTRDANTHMIPFESNLKSLGVMARDDDYFEGLNVTWNIAGRTLRHRVNTISISWELVEAEDAPEEIIGPDGSALFSPLNTGSVLSKDEIGYLEDALREAREIHEEEASESDNDSKDVDMGGYVSEEF